MYDIKRGRRSDRKESERLREREKSTESERWGKERERESDREGAYTIKK